MKAMNKAMKTLVTIAATIAIGAPNASAQGIVLEKQGHFSVGGSVIQH